MSSVSAACASAWTCGRSCCAPNEQLSPIVSGRAWRTACQKASTVWPERLRPERSVIVIEIISGTSRPCAWPASIAAMIPALAFSVSKTVSIRMKSTPPSISASHLLAIDLLQPVEVDLAIAGIVDVGRQRQGLVGRPDRAGDEARLAVLGLEVVGRLARDPGRGEVDLAHQMLGAVIGLADAVGVEGVGRDDVRRRRRNKRG